MGSNAYVSIVGKHFLARYDVVSFKVGNYAFSATVKSILRRSDGTKADIEIRYSLVTQRE